MRASRLTRSGRSNFWNLVLLTLETIAILCVVSRELKFITGNNIVEELKLCDLVRRDSASFQTKSESWSAFDSVLNECGAFPMLHRVSVVIEWRLYTWLRTI